MTQSANPGATGDIAQRLKALYTAAIYDVLDEMGLPNQCLDLGIKPLTPQGKIAGPAFTLGGGPDPRSEDEYDFELVKSFAFFRMMEPGCVVVITASGEDRAGHWGELMSTAARARGATGAVIDGGTRDRALIEAIPDWTLFARYASPVESKWRYRINAVQKPLAVRGALSSQVRVDPGDWLFGDADGVICIPQARLIEVLERAEAVEASEGRMREELRQGGDVGDLIRKYGRL